MTTFGWSRYAHVNVGIDTFGASAPYKEVYKKFGLVPEVITKKALQTIDFYSKNPVSLLFRKP